MATDAKEKDDSAREREIYDRSRLGFRYDPHTPEGESGRMMVKDKPFGGKLVPAESDEAAPETGAGQQRASAPAAKSETKTETPAVK